nr:MAG TPA: hypothetical protein [Bacteriophage sp.]
MCYFAFLKIFIKYYISIIKFSLRSSSRVFRLFYFFILLFGYTKIVISIIFLFIPDT